ncbi:MAG: DUF2283 domain-containing protein [bacterium]|nr:MAG: DUF2283 domain-containing protein [bacterium]
MNKTRMTYFREEDILHLVISDEKEMNSVEISPNITAELNKNGYIIGLEILDASNFVRDSIMEVAHTKLLNLSHKQFIKNIETTSQE